MVLPVQNQGVMASEMAIISGSERLLKPFMAGIEAMAFFI